MSARVTLPMTGSAGPRPLPSQAGLRLILAGTAYLLAITVLQLATLVSSAVGGPAGAPDRMTETRDVVALFGWVGLMISGVAVIIVPNHFRVHLRPVSLPTLHLVAANAGLLLLLSGGVLGVEALFTLGVAVVSLSFLAFGLALVLTVRPFLRMGGAAPGSRGRDAPLSSARASP